MSNSFYPNPTYYRERRQPRRQPGQMAAYLLGMGPMPPPTQEEIAVATANYLLDNPNPGPANLNVHDNDPEEDHIGTQQSQLPQVNHPQCKSHNVKQ